jgi:soluble lytic murein transglycosylase-like protein
MQVMVRTAVGINKRKITKENLRTNLKLNIETSMKLLRKLYNKYGRWDLVCGCYNTGRPIINEYALFCVNNKDYQKNWVRIKGV